MSAPTKSEQRYAQVWTDHLGVAHERHHNDHGRTLCDLNAGESNRPISARACRNCITERLASEIP
ncbi:hypothetical protein E1161_08425 [Saccharopolyspora aridisoli]|uniref:Uncharacterized protein n=1 Tax=Saccharopolyspora aridisoli TaxID=2530385 RepID=A0A4R4UP95_9PSEU|nr:hypothetical protein [Saccharopolyspora aridisoli]TDC94028.1 hypothetical protein E1161_08425 [Saccharopolyspora aridisoli]